METVAGCSGSGSGSGRTIKVVVVVVVEVVVSGVTAVGEGDGGGGGGGDGDGGGCGRRLVSFTGPLVSCCRTLGVFPGKRGTSMISRRDIGRGDLWGQWWRWLVRVVVWSGLRLVWVVWVVM